MSYTLFPHSRLSSDPPYLQQRSPKRALSPGKKHRIWIRDRISRMQMRKHTRSYPASFNTNSYGRATWAATPTMPTTEARKASLPSGTSPTSRARRRPKLQLLNNIRAHRNQYFQCKSSRMACKLHRPRATPSEVSRGDSRPLLPVVLVMRSPLPYSIEWPTPPLRHRLMLVKKGKSMERLVLDGMEASMSLACHLCDSRIPIVFHSLCSTN